MNININIRDVNITSDQVKSDQVLVQVQAITQCSAVQSKYLI